MANREDITPELLRQLLRYEPETGKLFWRKRSVGLHCTDRGVNIFNTRFANKPALTASMSTGYLNGLVLGKTYKAHRVIWALYYGEWPQYGIDHINHIKDDNRIANLRQVTQQENCKNQSRARNNTSGKTGISWNDKACKWHARIRVDGHLRSLGYFKNKDDAINERNLANVKYGFHDNHGL